MLDLQRRKAGAAGAFALVEGVRLVEEAPPPAPTAGAPWSPDLERTARGTALRAELKRQGIVVEDVSARALEKLADTETPQGIVAGWSRAMAADELPPPVVASCW